MRLLLAMLFITVAATGVADTGRSPARDASEDRRDRLKQYLAAFRGLSPAAQDRVRQLDKEMQDEDAAERARLFGVMERYAIWLSHLSDAERARVDAAPAGPERLQIVREIVDQQWLDGLPPARKEFLAKANAAERNTWLARWRDEDRDRQQERAWALQDMMIPAESRRQFFQDVERFAKTELEPKLGQKEKNQLQRASARGTMNYAYLHQVWMLSKAHGLTPPGPPGTWAKFKDPRPRP